MGMGEPPPPEKTKPRKRFSPFGCPPIPPSTKWKPTVFRCPKTSRTYPSGARDPSLMGQNTIQVWVRYGQLNYREYELYTCELSRSSTKECWKADQAIFVDHPTKRASVAQGLFMVGPTQSRSPHAPGGPKNASGPVGIPLKRGASGARQ